MSIQNLDSVCHYWAHQIESEAKTANGSLSFNGNELVSYSTPIGRIINNIVLLSYENYSVTTARHLSKARSATSHLKQYFVPDVGSKSWKKDCYKIEINHSDNLKFFKDQVSHLILKSSRATIYKSSYYNQAIEMLNNYNNYLIDFKIKRKPLNIDDYDVQAIKERANKERKKEKAKEAKKQREIIKANEENRKQWLNGLTNHFNAAYNQPILLRMNNEKETIETSRGANIPLKFAPLLWKLITRTIKNKKPWTKDHNHSFHVGYYTLDHIDIKGNIKVGCHNINYSELKKIAKLLGY